ncbi:GHKL domain-containing protein [Maribacter orientalis]|uniref:GHKL domain-containing protein n=1 Tax=Maribacter orientalis TaxID=228957 RepID=A0A1H7QLE7_9FLAO|nr:histidine kinase [Maribacter orientalis]SEL48629.1 GHKL domain-containing protein [Maribacter orientalis]
MGITKHIKVGIIEALLMVLLFSVFIYPRLQGIEDYVFIYPFNLKDGSIYWALFFSILFGGLLFFLNIYYAIPKYLKNKQVNKYILSIILLFFGLLGLEFLAKITLQAFYNLPENVELLYGVDYNNLPKRRSLEFPIGIRNLGFLALSFGYRYVKDWKQLMEERTRQQTILAEKWKVELKYLKSQVNPHFLFNNLNNIYAITKRNNDTEASEAITRLCSLTRFMLYDSSSKYIPIAKEIKYIQDYIEMQQLRFADEEVIVNLKLEGDIEHTNISPFILIPFVENAFKYGVKIHQNSIIRIEIKIIKGSLVFNVRNKIQHSENNHVYSGIGITNVKKRLQLVYANNYELNINNDEKYFEVRLRIDNL